MIYTSSDGRGACALALYAGGDQVALVGFNDRSVIVLGNTMQLRQIHAQTIKDLLDS